jgi:hypothetical protein
LRDQTKRGLDEAGGRLAFLAASAQGVVVEDSSEGLIRQELIRQELIRQVIRQVI